VNSQDWITLHVIAWGILLFFLAALVWMAQ